VLTWPKPSNHIAIDNQPGAVALYSRTLGEAKVNILSLLELLRAGWPVQLIAEDARRAKKALDGRQISYQETPAETYDLATSPVRSRMVWTSSPQKASI